MLSSTLYVRFWKAPGAQDEGGGATRRETDRPRTRHLSLVSGILSAYTPAAAPPGQPPPLTPITNYWDTATTLQSY